MTVYVGDIKAAINFLSTSISSVSDIERLSATDRATLVRAAQDLQDRLSNAVATLDAETGAGGLSGPPLAVAGASPIATAAALKAAIANSQQMATLVTLKGYVGRMQLNLGAAG